MRGSRAVVEDGECGALPTWVLMCGDELPLLLLLLLLLLLVDLVLVFGRAAGLPFVDEWVDRDDESELIPCEPRRRAQLDGTQCGWNYSMVNRKKRVEGDVGSCT